MQVIRHAAAFVVVGACALSTSPARADVKTECVDASFEGQTLRDGHKLKAARERLLACARAVCPAIVQTACADWLADVDKRMPTVVIRVVDAAGHDVEGARLYLDGNPLARGVEGKAIDLDPGGHVLRVERAGEPAVEEKVVVAEGEKGRILRVTVGPPEPPTGPKGGAGSAGADAAATSDGSFPVVPVILVGAGLAGIGAFAGLGLSAKSDVDAMRTTCAPACDPARVDAAKTKALAGDIALGVGAASVAAGVLVWLLRAPDSTTTRAAARVDARPTPGGAVVFLRGSF